MTPASASGRDLKTGRYDLVRDFNERLQETGRQETAFYNMLENEDDHDNTDNALKKQ